MKGSPIIRCNDEDDLFLCEGKKINITGKLTRSSPDPVEYPNVAIVTSGADRIVTSGYSQYNPDASDPSFFFFSYDHHYFTLENGEVYSEAFKTSYVYRYWDEAAEKVRTGRGERSDAIDVATLQDNSSVSLRDNWYIVSLADGAVLTCKDGIRSERKLNSVLNIYPQSEGTGKLIARTDGQNWAAIGGNTAADAGAFNLHGGTIEASAPRSGIAGGTNPDGDGGAGGPVKIFAGTSLGSGDRRRRFCSCLLGHPRGNCDLRRNRDRKILFWFRYRKRLRRGHQKHRRYFDLRRQDRRQRRYGHRRRQRQRQRLSSYQHLRR